MEFSNWIANSELNGFNEDWLDCVGTLDSQNQILFLRKLLELINIISISYLQKNYTALLAILKILT